MNAVWQKLDNQQTEKARIAYDVNYFQLVVYSGGK